MVVAKQQQGENRMTVTIKKCGAGSSVNIEMASHQAFDIADMMDNNIEAECGPMAFFSTMALFQALGALTMLCDEHNFVKTLDNNEIIETVNDLLINKPSYLRRAREISNKKRKAEGKAPVK
jgi:hypothetical protein